MSDIGGPESRLNEADLTAIASRQNARERRTQARGIRGAGAALQGLARAFGIIQEYRIERDEFRRRAIIEEEYGNFVRQHVQGYNLETDEFDQNLILDPAELAAAYDQWWDTEIDARMKDELRTSFARDRWDESSEGVKNRMGFEMLNEASVQANLAQDMERTRLSQSLVAQGDRQAHYDLWENAPVNEATRIREQTNGAVQITADSVFRTAQLIHDEHGLAAAMDYLKVADLSYELGDDVYTLGEEQRNALIERMKAYDNLEEVIDQRAFQMRADELTTGFVDMFVDLKGETTPEGLRAMTEKIRQALDAAHESDPDQFTVIEHFEQRLQNYIAGEPEPPPQQDVPEDFLHFFYETLNQPGVDPREKRQFLQNILSGPLYDWDGDGVDNFIGAPEGRNRLLRQITPGNNEYEAFSEIGALAESLYIMNVGTEDDPRWVADPAKTAAFSDQLADLAAGFDWTQEDAQSRFVGQAQRMMMNMEVAELNRRFAEFFEGGRFLPHRDEADFIGMMQRGRFALPPSMQPIFIDLAMTGSEAQGNDTTLLEQTIRDRLTDTERQFIDDQQIRVYAAMIDQTRGIREDFARQFPAFDDRLGIAIDPQEGYVAIIEDKTRPGGEQRYWRQRQDETGALVWDYSDDQGEHWIPGEPEALALQYRQTQLHQHFNLPVDEVTGEIDWTDWELLQSPVAAGTGTTAELEAIGQEELQRRVNARPLTESLIHAAEPGGGMHSRLNNKMIEVIEQWNPTNEQGGHILEHPMYLAGAEDLARLGDAMRGDWWIEEQFEAFQGEMPDTHIMALMERIAEEVRRQGDTSSPFYYFHYIENQRDFDRIIDTLREEERIRREQ